MTKSKQGKQKFDMKRFNLRKLNDVEMEEPYQVKVSARFAVQEVYMKVWTLVGLESINNRISVRVSPRVKTE
jgi:hypothetical protein